MDDLKLFKDKYGEKMMHFCRSAFSTILETPGLLFNLLKDNFEFSRFLYEDIEKEAAFDMFKNYIYSMLQEDKAKVASEKTPKELFEELGYNFYECKTEEEIQYFKKYYKLEEELCTFSGGRLKTCYVAEYLHIRPQLQYIYLHALLPWQTADVRSSLSL